MNKKEVIEKTKEYVRQKLEGESSGHDWWHTWRVWQMAKRIAKEEKVDMFIVEMASLLHDVADYKVTKNSKKVFHDMQEWLVANSVKRENAVAIIDVARDIGFRGGYMKKSPENLEEKIVSDADMLDALGAIGIARVFEFGGNRGFKMHDPQKMPRKFQDENEYKFQKEKGTDINHFYEKILLLKDMMNTKTAKRIAQERHDYIVQYLNRFYKEWEGKK
jgi:uncharacterized protein